jgi:hypothetical protein
MEESTSNNQEHEEHEMISNSINNNMTLYNFFSTNTPSGNEFSAPRYPMSVSYTPTLKSNDPPAPSVPIITENIFDLHSNFVSQSLPYGMGNSK